MLNIGCHLSTAKGFLAMGRDALSIGANTFQFFTRNPRGGQAKAIDQADLDAFLALAAEHQFVQLLAHAPYTLNPCSADENTRRFALEAMQDDLVRMECLPGNLYNFHPGSHVGQGEDAGIELIVAQLNAVLTPALTTTVLLETMAGKGSEVGRTFEELRRILDGVVLHEKMGVCLDTCHVSDAGYDIGEVPGLAAGDGDALMHTLIERGGQDPDWLTDGQLAGNPIRIPAARYRDWFATLPAELADAMVTHWGPPPGELFVDRSRDPDGEIIVAAMQSGNTVILVQPPRGFGENPVAIYHDPDLPPSHHYLATYLWLHHEFGAHAVVHLGKHGNLEWLPGKTVGMSAVCGSDAALGDLPLIYPFLVNDPGEGTQAKRRAHATLVDHLIPPMARAESYGDIARLEQLLDEHANIAALDPGKLPAVRQQIWTLMRAARMDHDLGLAERPEDDSFDDMLLHVDGWPKVERVLHFIDAIEARGIDPIEVSPDHWRHVHNRMTVGETPRAYGLRQHRAFLLREEIGA